MMEIMKKVKLLMIAVLFLLGTVSVSTNASTQYVHIVSPVYARVQQVIDGDALRVQISGTNSTALVWLAGVNTVGRRDAQDYMTGAILGRTVELVPSLAGLPDDRFDDRWTPVYMTYSHWNPARRAYDRILYNRALVQRGLAYIDPSYIYHFLWFNLVNDANRARSAQLGIWADEGFRTSRTWVGRGHRIRGGVWDERVNINTASAGQINTFLENTGAGTAIVRFRNHAPFQHVGEVKFADVLDREEFDYFWGAMKVSTNINTASREELMQLFGVNATQANNIIRERERAWFSDIYQLRDRNLMSSSVFEENRPFISVGDRERIIAADPDIIVNLNTASASDLQRAGLTSAQANAVVDARANGYTFKSLGEIQALPRVSIADRRLHEIADNIRVGDYWLDWWNWGNWGDDNNWIDDWHQRTVRININTATREELWRVGFSEPQVNHLLGRRGRMNSPRDIPFNVAEFDHAITLFTNVNTATAEEWMSLSTGMSHSFASTLEQETEFQPFGSIREVQDFFYDNDYHNVFRQIRSFIVLR